MSKPATRTAAEPGAAEHKQRSSLALRRPVWSPTALVDQGFFIFAGVGDYGIFRIAALAPYLK